jgi:hypothetical protein
MSFFANPSTKGASGPVTRTLVETLICASYPATCRKDAIIARADYAARVSFRSVEDAPPLGIIREAA